MKQLIYNIKRNITLSFLTDKRDEMFIGDGEYSHKQLVDLDNTITLLTLEKLKEKVRKIELKQLTLHN